MPPWVSEQSTPVAPAARTCWKRGMTLAEARSCISDSGSMAARTPAPHRQRCFTSGACTASITCAQTVAPQIKGCSQRTAPTESMIHLGVMMTRDRVQGGPDSCKTMGWQPPGRCDDTYSASQGGCRVHDHSQQHATGTERMEPHISERPQASPSPRPLLPPVSPRPRPRPAHGIRS